MHLHRGSFVENLFAVAATGSKFAFKMNHNLKKLHRVSNHRKMFCRLLRVYICDCICVIGRLLATPHMEDTAFVYCFIR
jgi:hypothetical protein